ncbi:MAG: LPS export ABC transporter permease LptF [Gammaproteobacteria bacterium]|jgi:lipopolysaccharide export system permease protein|nr:LPS export ABC transporter permease LptF [Gammaproteobacteria bacterium]MBT6755329.1 LPS export ABC transporter permease LptF [Gammaproteobacteria bacterium]MBT7523600.1 LPS export ABC transporter permease LptF [Gammaproteobacteria bacterium]MBT7814204.1 LPS export ABC transporter permease LptF [Gammaproteobacteria bacterium]
MKNNSKYTKNKEKWLDIYNSCKYKLYQFKKKIITIFVIYQNKNFILSLNTFKKLKIEKLTILDKYILKNFIFAFLSVLSVLILVIVGRLFVKLLEYVVEGRFDIEMIFSLLFLSTSKSIILLLPFALMIGLIISLSKLYRDGEIYALKASGNYKTVFTKIFYIVSIPLFIIIFTLNMFISPILITEIQTKKIEAAATSEIGLTTPGKFIQMKNKNWIIFVEEIENEVSKKIFIKSSDNNKISIETAEEGNEFIENGIRRLVLKNGQRYTGTPGTGNFQVMKYDEHEVKLVNTTPEFSLNYRMKSISDLIYDDNKALSSAEIQWRLFAPLSTLILILFAFVLGDVAPRQNKYSNLLFAIIIYFIYSNLAIVSVNEVQKNSNLFSFVGTWWVHILALLSCYLIYIIKKLQIKSYSNLKFYIKNYKR